RIVSIELEKVSLRLADNQITLTATEAALDKLAEEGYDPEMGARPLRRVIQYKIEDKLSDAVLAKEFTESDTVVVDVDPETSEIILRAKEKDPAEPEQAVEVN
ncbi:MAG TPA: NDP-hexose 4-ketoreductase, partial [Anaerolinea sp.]|nr:NDP-hexose 4-ketoreductase [Anaerolinea sp.]